MKSAFCVVYLTNSCGEETGYGTNEINEEDYKKVTFEDGPGTVLTYLGEIDGEKYIVGNVHFPYEDVFWGNDASDFPPLEVVLKQCQTASKDIQSRLTSHMLLQISDEEPGRLIVQVAIRMDQLSDAAMTHQVLRFVFGALHCQTDNQTSAVTWERIAEDEISKASIRRMDKGF